MVTQMEHDQSSYFCWGPDDFCGGPAPVGPNLVTGPEHNAENFVKCKHVVVEIYKRQTDRQTDRLITILRITCTGTTRKTICKCPNV